MVFSINQASKSYGKRLIFAVSIPDKLLFSNFACGKQQLL